MKPSLPSIALGASLLLAAPQARAQAAPPVLAASKAELVIHVPRLDKAVGVGAFFQRAGESSVALRPSSWGADLHPLVHADITDPASLRAAGLDPAGSLTSSRMAESVLSCATVKEPAVFQKRALLGLGEHGQTPWKGKVLGLPAVGATVTNAQKKQELAAALIAKGAEACSIVSRHATEPLLKEAAGLLNGSPKAPAWRDLPGVAYVVTPEAAIGLSGTETSLQLDARSGKLPFPALAGAGPSPYAGLPASGLLFARARLAPSAYPRVLEALTEGVARTCAGCDKKALAALAQELQGQLTGAALLRVDRFVNDSDGSLRSAAARAYATKQVVIAEVARPEAVAKALAAIASSPGVRKTENGYALAMQLGELELGLRGKHLFLGNDTAAIQAGLEALGTATPGTQPHGLELTLDSKRTVRALAQISLFDAVASPELAAVVAAGTELGPLLDVTERITGWADGTGTAGTFRGSLTWALGPRRQR